MQPAYLCAVMLPPISHLWAGPQILPHCTGREGPATDTTINHIPPCPPHFQGGDKVKAKGDCSQHCPIWELCFSRSSEQAVMGSLVRRSSRGCWGCRVLGWVTNEEPILLFLHPAQEFGHYQDGTCLGHQGAEAGIELKFGGHLWI